MSEWIDELSDAEVTAWAADDWKDTIGDLLRENASMRAELSSVVREGHAALATIERVHELIDTYQEPYTADAIRAALKGDS